MDYTPILGMQSVQITCVLYKCTRMVFTPREINTKI